MSMKMYILKQWDTLNVINQKEYFSVPCELFKNAFHNLISLWLKLIFVQRDFLNILS